MRWLAAVLLVCATAHADTKSDVEALFKNITTATPTKTMTTPRFAITLDNIDVNPTDYTGTLIFAPQGEADKPVVGVSADGTAAWIAGDITPTPCIRGALPGDMSGDSSYYEGDRCKWEAKGAYAKEALVAEHVTKEWQAVAWHIYGFSPERVTPPYYTEMPSDVPDAAKDAVAVLTDSLKSAATLTKTLSPRPDTAMFGSGKNEGAVGAKAIGALLKKWNLQFAVRGGISAGVAGKSVVWAAVLLEATNMKKPKAAHDFYRGFFVYEHVGASWQLVQLSFSDSLPPAKK